MPSVQRCPLLKGSTVYTENSYVLYPIPILSLFLSIPSLYYAFFLKFIGYFIYLFLCTISVSH